MVQNLTIVFLAIAALIANVSAFFLDRRIKAIEAWQREVMEEQERATASFKLDENDFDRQLL